MGSKSKVFISLAVLGVVASLAVLQVTNKDLFQGMLKINPGSQTTTTGALKLPDLKPTLQVLPNDEKGNLKIAVTIENAGEGAIPATSQYNYAVYVNDQIIFTNTDSYSEMGPGNKFSFTYPIEKSIYKYAATGTVKIVVDGEGQVEETRDDNNTAEKEYKL